MTSAAGLAHMVTSDEHFIPQFHLREFGVETLRVRAVPGRFGRRPGHVIQFRKDAAAVSRVPISKAAQRPGYYSAAHPDLEKAFALLEGRAAGAISRILDLAPGDHGLSVLDRYAISTYLGLLWVRGPAHRELTAAMGRIGALMQLDINLTHPEKFSKDSRRAGSKRSGAELEQERARLLAELRRGDLTIEMDPRATLLSVPAALTDHAEKLFSRRWVLVRVDEIPYLVLGDHPVVVTDGIELNVGLARPFSAVLAPLAPTALLLLLQSSNEAEAGISVVLDDGPDLDDASMAAEANKLAWRSARDYVFAHSASHLEAVQLSLDPSLRMSRPKVFVAGLPSEWATYATGDIAPFEDPALPANVMRWTINDTIPMSVGARAGERLSEAVERMKRARDA